MMNLRESITGSPTKIVPFQRLETVQARRSRPLRGDGIHQASTASTALEFCGEWAYARAERPRCLDWIRTAAVCAGRGGAISIGGKAEVMAEVEAFEGRHEQLSSSRRECGLKAATAAAAASQMTKFFNFWAN